MPSIETRGCLLAIGGGEDKAGDRVILRRFVDLAGGANARIVVVPAASALFDETGERYARLFAGLGAHGVDVFPARTREQANDASALGMLGEATGIFFGGGDQLRLTTTFGATAALEAIVRQHAAGAVVAGTSAGASALSRHMIAFGAAGGTPKKRQVYLAAGLGLIADVCFDQHFAERDRVGRLLAVVAQNPALLGVGLDEDTAVVVTPERTMEVVGSGGVTILDGAGITHTNAPDVAGHGPLAVTGARLHVLTHGYRFDLDSRRPIL